MARPRKSLELHRYHGTRPNPEKVKPTALFVSGRPRWPKHLGPDAKRAFKHACQLLEQRKTLTPADESLLALYAEIYSRWCDQKSQLGNRYMVETVVLDSHGTAHTVLKVNPLLKLVNESEQRLLQIIRALGMSPVDKNRATQTHHDPEQDVIPGSALDTHPELFSGDSNVVEFAAPTPLSPEELANEHIELDRDS